MNDPIEERFLELGQICASGASPEIKLTQIGAVARGGWEEEWMRVAAVATVSNPTSVGLALAGQLRQGVFLVKPKGDRELAVMEALVPMRPKLLEVLAPWRALVSPGNKQFGKAKGFACLVVGFEEDIRGVFAAIKVNLAPGWGVEVSEEREATVIECLGFVNRLVERFDVERELGGNRDRISEEERLRAAEAGEVVVDPLVLRALRR